jgi:hypothetical protein
MLLSSEYELEETLEKLLTDPYYNGLTQKMKDALDAYDLAEEKHGEQKLKEKPNLCDFLPLDEVEKFYPNVQVFLDKLNLSLQYTPRFRIHVSNKKRKHCLR